MLYPVSGFLCVLNCNILSISHRLKVISVFLFKWHFHVRGQNLGGLGDYCIQNMISCIPEPQKALPYVRTRRLSYRTRKSASPFRPVSYTHLRAHETDSYLVCRLLLEKKKNKNI